MEAEKKLESSIIQSEVDLDNEFKLSLDIRAKMELLERPGRRFCKKCMTMKVISILF